MNDAPQKPRVGSPAALELPVELDLQHGAAKPRNDNITGHTNRRTAGISHKGGEGDIRHSRTVHPTTIPCPGDSSPVLPQPEIPTAAPLAPAERTPPPVILVPEPASIPQRARMGPDCQDRQAWSCVGEETETT